jgi:cytochrome P450
VSLIQELLVRRFSRVDEYNILISTPTQACWILLYISFYGEWKKKISEEVTSLIQKHTNTTSSDPLHERLAAIPISIWEDEMPVLEAVLRETLRMAINGTTLRRNLLEDLNIQGEVIAKGDFMVYSQADAHMNPDIYAAPTAFDPERFSVGRSEDKNQTHAFLGWGAGETISLKDGVDQAECNSSGRHPCTGVKVAKLEIKIIVALFVAGYEFDIVDSFGNFPKSTPNPNFNDIHQVCQFFQTKPS